jgi:hypothetical protein
MSQTHLTPAPAASLDTIRRPLKDLLAELPLLPVLLAGDPNYEGADPELLLRLAEHAELSLQIIRGGVAAMGLLQPYAAQHIENGDTKANHATALGRLLVELGEVR